MTDPTVPAAPEQYGTFTEALAAFQAHLPSVKKGNTAKVDSSKGSYSYDYADLTDVSEIVLPALAKVGLSWFTGLDTAESGALWLTWELAHTSGEGRTGKVPVGQAGQNWQTIGSGITYARRYALTAATGVAPGGDDTDGADAYAGERPAATQAPIEQTKEYLPEGLYDLSKLVHREDAQEMFYTARGSGHLNLVIGLEGGGEAKFGDWLRAHGNSLPKREPTPEEIEAAQVAAHEAEVAAAEAAGQPVATDSQAEGTAETAQAPRTDDDAPQGDR